MILYHGSPSIIKDQNIAAGAYFSEDIEVAKAYGDVLYIFETNTQTETIFKKDDFDEHWISRRAIPISEMQVSTICCRRVFMEYST